MSKLRAHEIRFTPEEHRRMIAAGLDWYVERERIALERYESARAAPWRRYAWARAKRQEKWPRSA